MIEEGETETQVIEEALRDEEGRLDFVKVASAITDCNRAEEALQDCEEHYFSLFKNMLNGFAYCQMHFEQERPVDFTYLEVNDVFEDLTGLKNVVGKRASEVLPGIRESDPKLLEIYGRVALTAIPERFEIYVEALKMWFSISVYSPHRGYFVALFDVITKRKGAEALCRLNEELEHRVGKRTAELRLMVAQLQAEVTNRQQTEESLKQSEGRLRLLTTQLLTVQEAERQRLARDLHDDLGQSLVVLKLQLRAIQRMAPLESSETRESLERSLNFINEIVEKTRRLSRNLLPSILQDLGLTEALKHLFKGFGQNIQVTMDMDDAKGLFPQEGELNIYRIFQESFSNIVKYAQASRVSLSIKRQDGGVTFQVEDNGRGFDHQKVINENITDRGLGLTAMEERARMLGGSLDIWSQEGQGTKIILVAPIQVK